MPYPDSAIDKALDQVTNSYVCERISRKRRDRVRAEMIRLRDQAGPRAGEPPSDADLALALNIRAKDLLGLNPETGFYLPPEER